MKECAICHNEGSNHLLEDGRDVHFDCYYRLYVAVNDEDGNKRFEELTNHYGSYKLEELMRKMPGAKREDGKRDMNSYNKYNRKWPWDAKQGISKLEDVQEFIPSADIDPVSKAILKEEKQRYLDSLTDKQRFVIEKKDEGYKPKEIAGMLGEKHSGRVRWHIFAAKKKLAELIEGMKGE